MSIERTQEVELSCDEAFALLDQFAERQLREAEAARLMPLLEHHLKMCADCREEYEAVVRILKASGASSTL